METPNLPLAIAGLLVVVGPFLVLMALGAMLPTIDFDAIEYHLAAPKEYFLEGKIRFLPTGRKCTAKSAAGCATTDMPSGMSC